MIILVAACALAYPVDATAESALEYAVFDQQAGTLEMVFDAPSTYGNLTLRPDGAGSFLAYDGDAEHRNVLALDVVALEQFRNITCPTLHVGAGSFVDTDGTPIDSHSVPLWIVPGDSWMPPRPGVDVSCILTYRIVESPLNPSGDLLGAVRDGIEAWSELNPGLELRHAETGEANIRIKFSEGDANNALGIACTDCIYTYATEQVIQRCSSELVDPNQGAMIVLNAGISDYKILRNAAAHEFGHNLGLCHHQSADHLMGSGSRNDIQTPYDDLGYNIPEPLEGNSLTAIDVVVACAIVAAGIIVVAVWRRARRARFDLKQRQFQQIKPVNKTWVLRIVRALSCVVCGLFYLIAAGVILLLEIIPTAAELVGLSGAIFGDSPYELVTFLRIATVAGGLYIAYRLSRSKYCRMCHGDQVAVGGSGAKSGNA